MRHESGTVIQADEVLLKWLDSLPSEDGFVHISGAKRFAHDEAKYDEQYANEAADMQVGQGIMHLLRESDAPFDGAALEVGCGTGLATVGLMSQMPYPLLIATDPSPAFLRITRDKLKSQGLLSERGSEEDR